MIRLEIDIEPTLTALQAMLERLRDLRPAWRSVLAYLRRAMIGTFATQGQRIGQPWRPLSATYAKYKAVKFPGQPILRASDRMFGSLVGSNNEAVEDVERQSLTYGTRTPYAKYHQRGTPRMAKRRFLTVTETDRREIQAAVKAHLRHQGAISGFGGLR